MEADGHPLKADSQTQSCDGKAEGVCVLHFYYRQQELGLSLKEPHCVSLSSLWLKAFQ